MRCLFYVPQMAEYGGLERHVCLLALLLANQGNAVTLITTSNSLNQAARTDLKTCGVQFRELAVARERAPKVLKSAWLLGQSLRLKLQSWDLIYTNGQSGLTRLPWLAGSRRTRIVHHHHTAGDVEEQKTWHPAFRRALSAAPELIACSRSTKSNLEAALGRDDVQFLPYLTPRIATPASQGKNGTPPARVLNFGFAGRLVSTKGIDIICQLSDDPELASIRWHIYGSGDAYPASYFSRFENIDYHGPYSSPVDGAAAFDRLDAIALYSKHNEGMPLSLIEAMAAGLPWIATDRGGTRELALIRENCELIPTSADFADVKRRTLALASRIREGQTSRHEQRRAYDEHFSFDAAARQWVAFAYHQPAA